MNMSNSKHKIIFKIILCLIILFILILADLFYNDDNDSSSNSGWSSTDCPGNKTWDEMTSRERKACEEYFEGKFESGEWSFD